MARKPQKQLRTLEFPYGSLKKAMHKKHKTKGWLPSESPSGHQWRVTLPILARLRPHVAFPERARGALLQTGRKAFLTFTNGEFHIKFHILFFFFLVKLKALTKRSCVTAGRSCLFTSSPPPLPLAAIRGTCPGPSSASPHCVLSGTWICDFQAALKTLWWQRLHLFQRGV